MKATILSVLFTSLVLSACAVGGRPASPDLAEPLSQCGSSGTVPAKGCISQCRDPANESCPMLNHVPNEVREIKVTDEPVPLLGLALSGGGSKAAPFAIGVIKRFIDNGWIYRTHYLTSVSGGGYAAFYLYYRAYRAVMAAEHANDPQQPQITPDEVTVEADPQWPGLTPYFADARDVSDKTASWPYLTVRSSDFAKNGPPMPYSLASNLKGCLNLMPVDPGAVPVQYYDMWIAQKQEFYQGWVECYQDMLMTHPAVESTTTPDDSQLAADFGLLFLESIATAPAHYVANLIFDWKKPLSPTQYDYLYGIERTYAFFPGRNDALPRPLHDEVFRQLANCLEFRDIAQIYLADDATINNAIGGTLPKWIMESTGTNGNVGLDLSPQHYDLSQDVFEISFDEYGSGRFGYVKGAPSVIGLTVPYAVLASAAFADTAQRSLTVPRGVVDIAIQGFNIRWGIDVPNYNVSNAHRIAHSFLIWPFYYLDDPMTPYTRYAAHAPTIHLSDGGQSGDNLGLVAMFRRGVKNIVVAAGEDDFHNSNADPDGWLDFGSLCAANYYLLQRGFTLEFDDPRVPDSSSGGKEAKFNLKDYCTWDGNRQVYIHPETVKLSPFNWKRRVWVGKVVKYDTFPIPAPGHPELPQPQETWTPANEIPAGLENIKVYYLNAAIDRNRWVSLSTNWYPEDGLLGFAPYPDYPFTLSGNTSKESSAPELTFVWYPAPSPAMPLLTPREWRCEGEFIALEGSNPNAMRQALYSCPLLAYVYATNDWVVKTHSHWLFPQTSTWFTTFDNSINLFRAYRDLGWEYAGALSDSGNPELDDLANALAGPTNHVSPNFRNEYPAAITAYRNPDVCKGWVGAPAMPYLQNPPADTARTQ